MTLRPALAGAALAALALVIAGAPPAPAAVKTCDVMPTRCYYKPDGRRYYTLPGHRMPDFARTPRNGADQAPHRAAWGCGTTDGTARHRSWNYSNRTAAMYRALSECAKHNTGKCRVISCSPSVHTSYEALALWGANAPR
jgi:hypothetical protein